MEKTWKIPREVNSSDIKKAVFLIRNRDYKEQPSIACKIVDSFKKIVVTKDIVPTHDDENGILTVNIYEFLLNPRSIEG